MLNNRQRSQLQALANPLVSVGQIGKEGIKNSLLVFLDDALENHELIKVKVLKNCGWNLNELTIELTRKLHCELVQTIGHVLVLYRGNRQQAKIRLVK